MAVKFQFVNAFLCERALIDQDKILSAIRIVDLFQVPENAPETTVLQFYAIISLKLFPVPDETVLIGATLVRVNGEREPIAYSHSGKPFRLLDHSPDPSVPGGLNLVIQLNIVPKNAGTAYFEIDVDGEVVTRIPFTIRRIPAPPAQ